MRERHMEQKPSIRWMVMGVLHLEFGNNEFGLVVDKWMMEYAFSSCSWSSLSRPWSLDVTETLRVMWKTKVFKLV
ncbi:hypothetical protein L204_105906 [Cryptococcus depauperatus]